MVVHWDDLWVYLERFVPQVVVMVFCSVALIVFVFGDFFSGIAKSKANGVPITSAKMRRTIVKLGRYGFVVFGCYFIDFMQMISIHIINSESNRRFWVIPIFSILSTIFNCYVEYKSIRESFSKKQLALEKEALKDLSEAIDYVIKKKGELKGSNFDVKHTDYFYEDERDI